MTAGLDKVRTHLREYFAGAGILGDPDTASVTFVGLQPIDVMRFGPGPDGVTHYASVGGSRYSEADNPAEVVVSLSAASLPVGLARSVAVLAAAPAVEGLILTPDALVDLGQPLWRAAPFTAFLLGDSAIEAVEGIEFVSATPITANEAAWVRLKGADAMREAWREDGVDVLDPGRSAARPR